MQQPPWISGSELRERDTTDSVLRLLLENNLKHAIYLLDPQGRIRSWNQGARKHYIYEPGQILGQDLSILYPPEDVAGGAPAADLHHARKVGSCSVERWQLRKDGSRFWADIHLTALFDAGGTLYGYGEFTQDCTVSHHENQMYRSVMGSLRSHMAVLDKSGTILLVNDAWNQFARENGAPPAETVGAGVNYLEVCRRASGKHSEGAQEVLQGIESVLERSSPEFTREYACPSPARNRWFLLSATPWGSDNGGAVVSHIDITERVLAERKLRGSEEHYRALIENEVDVVTILKPDGRICFESPALERSLGYKPEELVGKNAFDFINPLDLPAVKKEIADVLKKNEPSRPVEFGFRHKLGGWRILESFARNLLANPAVNGIIVNSRDITERREAEAELRNKEAALQRSHQQLQALAGKLLSAEERERRRLSRELHDDLNQKLAMLAVDLGTLGRSAAKKAPAQVRRELRELQARVVKVSDEVRTMAYQLHPSILDHLGLAFALRSYCAEFSIREGIEVSFFHRNVKANVSPEIASCLYRITQEGLRNIAKHANAKEASVSILGSKTHVALTIRDWGAGFRPGAVRSRPSLGLTSMTERARQVGGEFQIQSEPKQGTTLTVRIPRRQAPPQ